MSSNAYYIAQTAIVIALVMISASASGCEVIGGIFKAGVFVGVIGLAIIVAAIVWIARRARG